MTDARRRPTGLLLAVVVAVIAVASLVSFVRGHDPSVVEVLRRRVESEVDLRRFAFRYQRAGTRVLDCVLPNLRFDVAVDRAVGVAAFQAPDGGTTIAVRTHGTVLVSRDLFDSPPFPTPWLAVSLTGGTRQIEAVRRAVGADLASYLFAVDLPASGRATVLAALDVATAVRPIGTEQIDGITADSFRITVDPAKFAATASSAGPSTSAHASSIVPRFDVALARQRGTIVRLAVSSQNNGAPGAPEDGWVISYRAASASTPALPVPSAITDASTIDLAHLAATPMPCQLPS